MHPVFIHGVSVNRSWRDTSRSLGELIFANVSSALADAGMTAADADSVVLGAHDVVDGRGLTSMVTAPAAAAYLKDEVRLSEDGLHAMVQAIARVRCGHSKVSVVAAWGRLSEGQPDGIANAMFDPFFSRPLGMTEVAVSALRASSALRQYPDYAEFRSAAGQHRTRGDDDPRRAPSLPLPLRSSELPWWADVTASAVISSEPGPVELIGVGMGSEPFELGDRDLLGLPALRVASAGALDMARAKVGDIDVLELDGLTLFDDALAAEAVGAAERGTGMKFLAEGNRVNRDGGSAAGYGAPAMGLVRLGAAYAQLRGSAGRMALISGGSTVAAQTQAAVVAVAR